MEYINSLTTNTLRMQILKSVLTTECASLKKYIIIDVVGADNKNPLIPIVGEFGLSSDNINFVEYDKVKKCSKFGKMDAIIIGPIPHKLKDVEKNLILSCKEKGLCYSESRSDSHTLKLTKSSFRDSLCEVLIDLFGDPLVA